MDKGGQESLFGSTVVLTLVSGGFIALLFYILRLLKADNGNNVVELGKNETATLEAEKKKEPVTSTQRSKKKQHSWTGRSDRQFYSHPWLSTTLKGHTGQVLDMDFSSNGKYLASCAEEDPDPGGEAGGSSGSECNKENSRPSSTELSSPGSKGLSRRQRKNRRREDSSPPESKKKTKPKRPEMPAKRVINYTPLRQFQKLNLQERVLAAFLRSYLLSPQQMITLGYPIESTLYPGKVIIFKSPVNAPSAPNQHQSYNASRFDVNAQEFVPGGFGSPGVDYKYIKKEWNTNHDSGQGSGSSSDSGEALEDSEESSSSSSTPDQELCSGTPVREYSGPGEERKCVRCGKGFFVTPDGEYLTQEHCTYHWGKLQRVPQKVLKSYALNAEYSCCRGKEGSPGCSKGKLHVWNGLGVGFNGPFESYMRTRVRKSPPPDQNYGVYALDCEMCYTMGGLELAKITVVGADGRLVYDCFVKPEHEIVDYNTRFSGITAKDLSRKGVTKTLREVQNDLMGFINADTILVGHGLENDLRALRIVHNMVVDTAVTFPHYNGLPFKRSLKSLTSCFLKRDIQCSQGGHNSCEDARACMELMLWRVRKDFRTILDHCHQAQ